MRKEIQADIGEGPVAMAIDETTDLRGKCVVNVHVQKLNGSPTQSWLLLSEFIQGSVDFNAIYAVVVKACNILWGADTSM